jgi:hypothetical protein
MYTDLSDPHWTAVMTEEVNEEPLTTMLADRQASRVRLDGWGLSFSRKQFTVDVALTGTVPVLNQTEEIEVVRLQELDPSAEAVSGTLVKKTALVVVPTPEPTVEPTAEQEVIVIEVTPIPVETLVVAETPTRKQTYTPGPDPMMICIMLAGLILITGYFHRKI